MSVKADLLFLLLLLLFNDNVAEAEFKEDDDAGI